MRVFTPSECLDIRYCTPSEVSKSSYGITDHTRAIIAPISNVTLDLGAECYTDGSDWRLVVIDIVGRMYQHMCSIPGVSYQQALEYSNSVLIIV